MLNVMMTSSHIVATESNKLSNIQKTGHFQYVFFYLSFLFLGFGFADLNGNFFPSDEFQLSTYVFNVFQAMTRNLDSGLSHAHAQS